MGSSIALVAVEAAVYAIDKPYHYRVPQNMQAVAGMRCVVPFGAGNRRTEGVIVAVTDKDEEERELKTIERLLDDAPVLTDAMLHLAAFVRERYFCTLYQAVRALLPAGMWFRPHRDFQLAELPENWQERSLPDCAGEILTLLSDTKGVVSEELLRRQFAGHPVEEALSWLLQRKWVSADIHFRKNVREKTERLISLAVSAEEALAYAKRMQKRAPVQADVLRMLASVGCCDLKELRYYTAATAATLNRLEQMGYLQTEVCEVLRLPEMEPMQEAKPTTLNDEQRAAYLGMMTQWQQEKPGVALLYGVTGSGKTSIYLELIARCVEQGKQAIFMVPEIALTPQLVRQVTARFGKRVALIHSSVPMAKRYDTFRMIGRGEADVIVGTRSAVFAPTPNLGLVVVDEEQEHTYRSENSPRYHAVEVAIYRGMTEQALVVLGSATPSVESMYRARAGIYRLYTLKNRYNQKQLPPVTLVDMKQEMRSGNGTAISRPLLEALLENQRRGEQAILFLNRRGTSRMTVCVDCGFVPQCKHCSVHLTYHQANGRLMCHYCGYSAPLPARCPICGGRLQQVGFGTQRVEEQLQQLLPDTRVLRMDADTVSPANSHEKILNQFRQEKIPILLGTQMVTKGLDFENVTLVGVLNADTSLYAETYRAAETTFDLVTQVVGRAGRGQQPGRAILQTMTPEHMVLRLAAEQDYDSFYETEIRLRQVRLCPPFRDLVSITLSGLLEEQVQFAAQCLGNFCRRTLFAEPAQEDIMVLGPSPASVYRLSGRYRCRLTIGCRLDKTMRLTIATILKEFAKNRESKGVTTFVEVNGNDE